ncbi:MAG: PEP-CTERM sorting domain-containing protein [Phycisphaeraceae bacterium]|nr:PEP-CTERM sorting domain-containing protein [Phycisphaeraceae bacterium]
MKRIGYLSIPVCALAMALGPANESLAVNVAIINGASATTEVGTTASVTNQLVTLHTAAGNTPVVLDTIPVDLSPYTQVWDVRFFNAAALSAADRAQYVNYLAAGGGMFVMGENSFFMTRNNSVLALIDEAGGGSLTFQASGNSTQTVLPPFDQPNPVTSFTYPAPGWVTSSGTGSFMTIDPITGHGSGIAWSVGDLANAPLGALTVVFDVNFMQDNASAAEQAFTANLVRFVREQVDPDPDPDPSAIPEPATAGLALLAMGGLGGAFLRRRRHA